MKPRIFTIDPHNIDMELLKQAADVIHNRGLVAFPTETVYGLGANALDAKAVAAIFEAKGRPLDDPLIVHIADICDLEKLVCEVPQVAARLANRFWPGPLTMIFKKKELIPDIVTTGLETVAIRIPSNMIARKFIKISGVPIAAPSANMFGRPSPTTAQHVVDDLEGKVDVVLDGGSTEIGIESTVVEFAEDRVTVLRPGGVSVEDLRGIAGDVKVLSGDEGTMKSPGRYPQHYSPSAKVILVEMGSDQRDKVLSIARDEGAKGHRVGIMAKQENADFYPDFDVKILGPKKDLKICASRLFRILREFDADKVDIIVAEGVPENGLGLAVMNRLRKASAEAPEG